MTDFAEALGWLQSGMHVARGAWGGAHHLEFHSEKPQPIQLTDAGGAFTWHPAQADILANDWVILQEPRA